MQLTIETSWFFLALCVLLGAAYAAALYALPRRPRAKDKQLEDMSPRLRVVLAALRALSVAAIAFLLLSPMVKRNVNESQKPIVVIAEDNSKSLDYGGDSALLRGVYSKTMDEVARRLAKDCEVHRYLYGSSVRLLEQGEKPTYNDQATDMGVALQAINERYAGRNVAAVLLTGDGIFNQGLSPLTQAQQATYPIYAVAMGDTATRRDAAIVHVRCNEVAYVGSQFPVEVTIKAARMKGEASSLTVTQDGKKMCDMPVSYKDDHFNATLHLSLKAQRPGVQRYEIRLAPRPNESTALNNIYLLSVEIIDDQRKIAILSAFPHPDVAALKRAIETRRGNIADATLARDWKGRLGDYDLIVLHQLPAQATTQNDLVRQAMETHKPLMFVVGAQTDLARLNALHAGMEINTRGGKPNEATAAYNDAFALFGLDEATARSIEAFPPLVSPFGAYRLAGGMQPLFFARIGTVRSDQPLLTAGQAQGRRVAFVAGEGLWRWRLADYRQNGNTQAFDELVAKLVAYAAMQSTGERFRVKTKRLWHVGENVEFDGELYNDSYEPMNKPEATMEISGNGARKAYKLNRKGSSYHLNVGSLKPGSYAYSAAVAMADERLSAKGTFTVADANLEALDQVADHALLNTLATATGGKMLTPSQLKDFPNMLKKRGDTLPIIYTRKTYKELHNSPLAFCVMALLLSAEWIIRKRNGQR